MIFLVLIIDIDIGNQHFLHFYIHKGSQNVALIDF